MARRSSVRVFGLKERQSGESKCLRRRTSTGDETARFQPTTRTHSRCCPGAQDGQWPRWLELEPKFGSLQEGARVAELLCRLLQNLQHAGDPKNSDIWPRRVFKLPPFACTGARCGCRC